MESNLYYHYSYQRQYPYRPVKCLSAGLPPLLTGACANFTRHMHEICRYPSNEDQASLNCRKTSERKLATPTE